MIGPRKKKLESTPVHMTGVNKEVSDKAAEAIAHRAWKKEIILGLFLTVQTIALGYFHNRNTNAVIKGTTEVKVQTQEVAEKLKSSNEAHGSKIEEHGHKLDKVVITSQQNHALSNSLMLEMKRRLAERSRRLAEKTMNPADVTEAEVAEEAYLAHKKTHDEMQAREGDEGGEPTMRGNTTNGLKGAQKKTD